VAKVLSRRSPEAFPYSQRWILRLSGSFFPGWALRRAVEPQPGQRILEIGPGLGRHALDTARQIGVSGTIDVVDVQAPMLDDVAARARRARIDNVHTTLADARELPWDDATFDTAYMVTVLGEIPERQIALRQLSRVLKPGGRLVVGETILDPDSVSLRKLRKEAAAAGFTFERVSGPGVSYLASFSRV
jgi:ubiquinone/menaquinone biosynthesis C-methylase UbiE